MSIKAKMAKKRYLAAPDVARALGVNPSTVDRWRVGENVTAQQVGSRWFLCVDSVKTHTAGVFDAELEQALKTAATSK